MRFGCETIYGWFTLGKCAQTLNFSFNKSYGLHGSDSRYIAITNFHGSRKNFFVHGPRDMTALSLLHAFLSGLAVAFILVLL